MTTMMTALMITMMTVKLVMMPVGTRSSERGQWRTGYRHFLELGIPPGQFCSVIRYLPLDVFRNTAVNFELEFSQRNSPYRSCQERWFFFFGTYVAWRKLKTNS